MLKIKDIEQFEDYTIDIYGNVYSKRKNKYLKQTINKYGYCKVTLQKNKYNLYIFKIGSLYDYDKNYTVIKIKNNNFSQ